MKQQNNMRFLHMGCGESLAVSQTTRISGLEHKVTQMQKSVKTKQSKRRQANEGSC